MSRFLGIVVFDVDESNNNRVGFLVPVSEKRVVGRRLHELSSADAALKDCYETLVDEPNGRPDWKPGMYTINLPFEHDAMVGVLVAPNSAPFEVLQNLFSIRGSEPECNDMPAAISGFARVWELFGFVLSKKTRERVFEPAQQDLLAQYLRARQFSGKWERRWLNLCFTWRTVVLVAVCFGVTSWSAAVAFCWRFVPPGCKEWLLSFFR